MKKTLPILLLTIFIAFGFMVGCDEANPYTPRGDSFPSGDSGDVSYPPSTGLEEYDPKSGKEWVGLKANSQLSLDDNEKPTTFIYKYIPNTTNYLYVEADTKMKNGTTDTNPTVEWELPRNNPVHFDITNGDTYKVTGANPPRLYIPSPGQGVDDHITIILTIKYNSATSNVPITIKN